MYKISLHNLKKISSSSSEQNNDISIKLINTRDNISIRCFNDNAILTSIKEFNNMNKNINKIQSVVILKQNRNYDMIKQNSNRDDDDIRISAFCEIDK